MGQSNDERLAIRDESYRVVHAEVCRTCRHWQRFRMTEGGVCMIANTDKAVSPRPTSPLGTCDLWEGKPSDK